MAARPLSVCFGVWMLLLTGLFYLLPSQHLAVWTAIGLSAVAAVVSGALLHRPARRLPWLLLAAALLSFNAGDATYSVLTQYLGQVNPYPSWSDVQYLAMYPFVAGALLILIRYRSDGADRGSLLDALILTIALGLLVWIFLIAPYVHNDDLSLAQKAVSIAYPLGDVLCLAMLVRLLTATGLRTFAANALGVGIVGLLVADVVYGLIQLRGDWTVGGPTDLGWIVFYGACGAAALHPSMVTLTVPAAQARTTPGTARLALLAVTSLTGPAVLLVEDLHGAPYDALVIAVACAAMFLLVLARVAGLVVVDRQAADRERALREAGALLVGATRSRDVIATLGTAIRTLLPDEPHELVFGQEPKTAFPATLTAPLDLRESADGPQLGSLHLSASPAALRGLRPSFDVLVSQAALALDRIALTDEVHRRDSEAYFRTLIQNTSDVILIVADDNRIRWASPSGAGTFGVPTLTGMTLLELIEPADRDAVDDLLGSIRDGRLPRHEGVHVRALRRDGRDIEVEMAIRDLRADATVRGLVLTLRDVTERRQLERELTHQAFHDSLTGLANRVLFAERVDRSVAHAARDGSTVGVLIIDLDDFKIVNDTMGHTAGDELLVAVAARITGCLRPQDTAARLGGDEFAALIEQARDSSDAEQTAARIVAALAEPFEVTGETGLGMASGRASVGVATSAEAEGSVDLLRQADLALYAAKNAGKGGWRRYQSDLHTALVERLELRAALEKAVEEGQFLLQYQPIVDLISAEPIAVEALIRWNHPVRGVVGPDGFIELAEESGLIVPMGAWVLRDALRTLARWHHTIPDCPLRYISVNVSARQFRTPGFVELVQSAIAESGVPPSWLMLEITESLLLRDDDQVWGDLAVLRDSGVRVAIDDFGTGYSSLSYLRHMPVDVLKIDKSFIDGVLRSRQQRALVEAIAGLADTLELSVVAEGIEQPGQRQALATMGCPLGQGYLFSRPLWPTDLALWLFRRKWRTEGDVIEVADLTEAALPPPARAAVPN